MTCDELRKSATEGAPLDEAARAHLAACASCGEEFAELRALTAARPIAPGALRDRVLAAAFPSRPASAWPGVVHAAAILLVGLAVGFASGYAAKSPRVIEGPTVVVERPVEMPVSDDYVFNVGIAAERVYGNKVEVNYVPNSVRIQSIVIDPTVRGCEIYCPVARQLGSLAAKRPDVVVYKKKEY